MGKRVMEFRRYRAPPRPIFQRDLRFIRYTHVLFTSMVVDLARVILLFKSQVSNYRAE